MSKWNELGHSTGAQRPAKEENENQESKRGKAQGQGSLSLISELLNAPASCNRMENKQRATALEVAPPGSQNALHTGSSCALPCISNEEPQQGC